MKTQVNQNNNAPSEKISPLQGLLHDPPIPLTLDQSICSTNIPYFPFLPSSLDQYVFLSLFDQTLSVESCDRMNLNKSRLKKIYQSHKNKKNLLKSETLNTLKTSSFFWTIHFILSGSRSGPMSGIRSGSRSASGFVFWSGSLMLTTNLFIPVEIPNCTLLMIWVLHLTGIAIPPTEK